MPAILLAIQNQAAVTRIGWDDVAPLRNYLARGQITASNFADFVTRTHEANASRVRLGDLDHLVFYALQSTQFTRLPPIEPALSAKALVDAMNEADRAAYLRGTGTGLSAVPRGARERIAAFVRALGAGGGDARLVYFRQLMASAFPKDADRQHAVTNEYLRAMRFVYEKEFVAQRAERPENAVAELYRTRGLSTDTAVEAGYLVYQGLGVAASLAPKGSVRRVLIVGPGLDLAPRTGLIESGPPESYQPWAIIDALLSLGVARADALEVVAADINPRVVAHLRRAVKDPPTLTLVSGIAESATVSFTEDYRDYFKSLGVAIGMTPLAPLAVDRGHLRKAVRVRSEIGRLLRAETVDIVTERLAGERYDVIVATNILPYFNDVQLTMAMSNIGGMLAPGGMFLHNEPRPLLRELADALGLPVAQTRHAIIANVRGAAAPLFDSVWIHRRP